MTAKTWVVHPTGNANVREVLAGLEAAGGLDAFWTTLGWPADALWLRAVPGRWRAKLERRAYALPAARLRRVAGPELGRFLRPDRPRTAAEARARVDGVYRTLGGRVAEALRRTPASRRPAVVYAYEDGAEAVFEAARETGCRTVYDLPIGYGGVARRILAEEAERRPEWAATLGGLDEPPEKRAWKDREIALADAVLVASRFTAQTLEAYPGPRPPVHVLPYGAPPAAAVPPPPRRAGEPLRVLFVGGLSQRKGIADLFEAMELVGGAACLTVVGRRAAGCPALDAALARHRHIESLPPAGVLQTMRQHDVLVFPSLFEGFGLVITEALSQGLAVITTPHTVGPDLLTEGVEGHLVPIRSPERLAAAIAGLAGDAARLRAMQEAALVRARGLRWEHYGAEVAAVVAAVAKGGAA